MTPPLPSSVRRLITHACLTAALTCVPAAPARAQVSAADWIDWDLPSFEGAGVCPSAIGAVTLPPTGDPVYYVTTCPGASVANPGRMGPVLVRFVPGTPIETAVATWTAWNLGTPDADTGGMKITPNERVAFIRQGREIIRVDMTTNELTHWNDIDNLDPTLGRSDLALVQRGSGTASYVDVYTTHDDMVNHGILQRLTVQNGSTAATVRRWLVNANAGFYFLSGVAYFQGKIYFSDSTSISELDPATNHLKRWPLAEVGAADGRQISVDTKGIVWALTTSGHLVSLNPGSNEMASYMIPGAGAPPSPGVLANPFGIAASGGVVGFTESDGKKTGVLIPNAPPITVTPVEGTADFVDSKLTGTPETINPDSGVVEPQHKPNQPAVHTDLDPFGEFIEVTTPDTGNFPLGIFRDVERQLGTFYLVQALGGTTDHRLSHVAFNLQTEGLVTGGGTLYNTQSTSLTEVLEPDADAWGSTSTTNFGFNVYRKVEGGPVRGHLNYWNKLTDEHVRSLQVLTLAVVGNTAEFSGTCIARRAGVETPCNFTVTVEDNGNPGKGKDNFTIQGIGVTPNGGILTGGNIKIHQRGGQGSTN